MLYPVGAVSGKYSRFETTSVMLHGPYVASEPACAIVNAAFPWIRMVWSSTVWVNPEGNEMFELMFDWTSVPLIEFPL